ncbi:MAG: hypothetical protein ABIK68_14305, partial [bacterium]
DLLVMGICRKDIQANIEDEEQNSHTALLWCLCDLNTNSLKMQLGSIAGSGFHLCPLGGSLLGGFPQQGFSGNGDASDAAGK